MTQWGYWRELKRRNVLRAGVLYVGAVWALAQGISQLTPAIGLPEVATRWFLIGAIIGFPFWIAFAWFYEFTPEGFRHDTGVAADAPVRHSNARRLDFAIIGVLIVAVALLGSGYFIRRNSPAAVSAVPAKSIAVLPFVNMSGDSKEEYFSDGITEEILNALAQIPNLKVAARTSAFAFKGKEEDLRKVGHALGVMTVLEGSVQRSGDEVRITAQLIDTRSGYQLWSEKYDRRLTSIFAVEDEISKAIADKLRVQLTGGRPLVAQTQIDPRAHDLYLRGLALLAKRSLGEAADTFHQAIAIDPGYAQAWGALAETEIHMPGYFLDTQATALPRAEAAAKRALAIDPNTASAWIALGMINHMRWRWADADTAFRRALQLAPGDAEVIDQYALFLFSAGQFDAALREIDRAQALDPLAPVIGCVRINILYVMHRYPEAAAQARATIAAHPDFALARLLAMNVAIYQRHWHDAEALARKGAQLAGENPDDYALMVRGIADPVQRPAALRIVESAPADAHWELAPFTRIKWLALLGANDAALAAFDHAVTSGLGLGEQIIWDPALHSLRDDPRFKTVMKKMGLPYRPEATTPASATTGPAP